jgi:integrase
MGRRRQHDLDLPQHMYRRDGRYYYGRNHLALGADLRQALRKYGELATGVAAPGTLADAAEVYKREELPKKAAKTQDEYRRQLGTLVLAFGDHRLDEIEPSMVAAYLRARPRIAGTREKALLSALFNFARITGLTGAPNPCAGVRGAKSRRDRYVTDAEISDAIARADQMLGGFLELCYLTGQRPGDVVRLRRADAQDGVLHVRQGKTGAKVRIELVGPLAALYERLTAGCVGSLFLVRDEAGQPLTLGALRHRFDKLGCDWQIRDLRAKAASDADTARHAQTLLGHAAASTTDGYIRQRVGARATPIMRRVTEK